MHASAVMERKPVVGGPKELGLYLRELFPAAACELAGVYRNSRYNGHRDLDSAVAELGARVFRDQELKEVPIPIGELLIAYPTSLWDGDCEPKVVYRARI